MSKIKRWIKRVDGVRQRYTTGRTPKVCSSIPKSDALAFGSLDITYSGSRYNEGDEVEYNGQKAKITYVGRFFDDMSWRNNYNIELENGETKEEVMPSELKLLKRLNPKKRISFKNMQLPSGWSSAGQSSSKYYDSKHWGFTKDRNSVSISLRLNDTETWDNKKYPKGFYINWSLNGITYQDFNAGPYDTPEQAEQEAKNIMEKLDRGEIEPPEWAKDKASLPTFGSWKRDKEFPYIKQKLVMLNPQDIELIESDQDRRKIEEIKESGPIRKPINVHGKWSPEQKYLVFQGHHRTVAAQERKDEGIPAIVSINVPHMKAWRKREGLNGK